MKLIDLLKGLPVTEEELLSALYKEYTNAFERSVKLGLNSGDPIPMKKIKFSSGNREDGFNAVIGNESKYVETYIKAYFTIGEMEWALTYTMLDKDNIEIRAYAF